MKYIRRVCCGLVIFLTANIPLMKMIFPRLGGIALMLLLVFGTAVINIVPAASHRRLPGKRLKICADGCELLIYFLISVSASVICLLVTLPMLFPEDKMMWLGNLACVVLVEAAVFWSGIIRVYLTSAQIGIKWRTIGLACGWIPVVHLIVLLKIIRMASDEWEFESGKIMQAQERKDEMLCRTRYPILMEYLSGILNILTTGGGSLRSWRSTGRRYSMGTISRRRQLRTAGPSLRTASGRS